MDKSSVDWKTIAKLFGGGALVGGGAGAITSYMRHMDALQHELAAQNNTEDDDDVLYVDVNKKPTQKRASADATSGSTFALGSLGALLGAWVAYNGVRKHYNNARHKDLQGQLDEAQHLYVNNLQESVDPKQASFPALSVGSGTVGLAALLTMLGTAAVANRALNKQFPALKHPDRDKPKRIVVRTREEAPAASPEAVPEEAVEDTSPEGREAMLRTALLAPTKSASAFNWDDVVAATAQGRGAELIELCQNGLGDSVFDVCRGASEIKTSSLNRNLAVTWLATEPLVSRTLEPAMAATIAELGGPSLFKLASGLSPSASHHAVRLAELSTELVRQRSMSALRLPEIKQAFVPDELMAARALQRLLSDKEAPEEDDLEPLRNRASVQGKSKDSHEAEPLLEVHGKDAEKFLARYGPSLQAAL